MMTTQRFLMSNTDALFRPLVINGVRIRNRVMSTAHTSGASEDGKPQGRYQSYQEEKARGGIGLTIVGGSTTVAPDSPGADMLHLDASTDAIIPHYTALADRIHRHGATVFAQLAHMGRRANWDNDNWLPPVSPSGVREAAHRAFPKVMEDWDIARIIRAFGKAAGRVKAGGIDGLELSATHNHIFDQFWSSRTNQRTDGYGGTLQNRLRFTLEVIDAIRGEVGENFPLGLRMSGDELLDGGLTHDDLLEICETLSQTGRLDFFSVLGGSAENLPAHAMIFPGMEMPAAPYLYLAASIKQAVGVPVFHAQRIADVATAARAVEAGHIDMAAMTRPHMADPHIMRKLAEGRESDIRPCIGANYCIDRLYSGGQAFCLHNAATGREETMPHTIPRAPKRRRAVVVGAGPAGLEATRVLVERGHDVTLFEANPRTGGQVRMAAQLGWRRSLLAITDWLTAQVQARGADLRLNTHADAGTVQALNPDVVIVATGGTGCSKAQIEGVENALSVWDVLANPPSGQVLLFDDNGGEQALTAAEIMCNAGATLRFATADPAPGIRLERTTRPIFLRRLYDGGVEFTPNHRLRAITPANQGFTAHLVNEYTGAETQHNIDHVVVDYGTRPVDALYFALRPASVNGGEIDLPALVAGQPQTVHHNPDGRFQLFRIGDAVSSRNIHAGIYDALRLCKDL